MQERVLSGARLFDGQALRDGQAVVLAGGRIAAVVADGATASPAVRLPADHILAPGFVDLQVNGGDGLMLDGSADVAAIARIVAAHRRLGCAGVMPTLITDTPQATRRVIDAGIQAAEQGVAGFLGLHLEGPHLCRGRKGAHDAGLIRPMDGDDLALLLEAAVHLPHLMVTLSPRAVTTAQVAALAAAGVTVSLGHSTCTGAEAHAAFAAGAVCATHLFNAMDPMTARAPGLAGAVLAGQAAAGIIADGLHVVPDMLRIALAARPVGLFLVSDAMAVAGTGLASFTLGGREIRRAGGRLTLADGTLAGADLTLAQAAGVLVTQAGCPEARALAMATSVPAGVIGAGDLLGAIAPGRRADLVLLSPDWRVVQVWDGGQPVLPR